jgi:hypothetical protein
MRHFLRWIAVVKFEAVIVSTIHTDLSLEKLAPGFRKAFPLVGTLLFWIPVRNRRDPTKTATNRTLNGAARWRQYASRD